MPIFRFVQGVLLALVATGAIGYFLYVEIRQFIYFRSTQAVLERVEPVCFLSSEGRSSAADCASVRARAGGDKVYQMYRATLRYQSPADDREHVETILTRSLGPLMPGAHWKLLAHKTDATRVEPTNDGGRAILFGASVLLFVIWLRGALNRYVRRKVMAARAKPQPVGGWLIAAIAVALFFVFRTITPP